MAKPYQCKILLISKIKTSWKLEKKNTDKIVS
uniref:Uncharacterized protein n=1 Tax=Arundo donax TaxID=35708 RepID=A0A0A8ZWI1_ARUDO